MKRKERNCHPQHQAKRQAGTGWVGLRHGLVVAVPSSCPHLPAPPLLLSCLMCLVAGGRTTWLCSRLSFSVSLSLSFSPLCLLLLSLSLSLSGRTATEAVSVERGGNALVLVCMCLSTIFHFFSILLLFFSYTFPY